MARSRNIKPGFFDNSELGAQDSDIRLLFIALWQLADREGILEYNPAVLRRYAFGYRDSVTDKDINRYITVMSRLDNGDTLDIKQLGNNQYIIITNFERHQSPHHTEKKGKLPSLEALLEAGSVDLTVRQPLLHGENPSDSCFLIPDSCIMIPDSINTHSNAPALVKNSEKPKLEELSFKHIEEWLIQQETRGSPIAIDVKSELEKFKTHFLSYNGKDKNGNTISDWVAKFGNWLLAEQSRTKNGGSVNGKDSRYHQQTGRHQKSETSGRSKFDLEAERIKKQQIADFENKLQLGSSELSELAALSN